MTDLATVEKFDSTTVVRQPCRRSIAAATPHATAVTYAAAGEGTNLTLYITTRTTNIKVRNIRRRPQVAFVIPVPHRFLPMMPPAAIQFAGSAEILNHEKNADARGGIPCGLVPPSHSRRRGAHRLSEC